jgi:hypothetical protein
MGKAQTPSQHITRPTAQLFAISTVARGKGVPVLYGTNKVSADLIWTRDFHFVSVAQRTQGNVHAGKGFGGGGGGQQSPGNQTLYYFAALLYAICEGPIQGIVAIRSGSTWVYFDGGMPYASWPQTAGNLSVNTGAAFEGYPLASTLPGVSGTYATQIPLWILQTDRPTLAYFKANSMINVQGQISPINNAGYQYDGTHFDHIPGSVTWASEGVGIQYGTAFQAPPPYISSRYPGEDIPYSRVATLFFPAFQLGQSASPPALEIWVIGMLAYDPAGVTTGTPILDAMPYSIITDLLTDPVHGLGVSPAYIDSMWQFRAFTVASGLFLSVSITGQQQIQQIIQLIMQQTVCDMWWSEGRLKAQPWYDLPITGYGLVYTPVSTVVYNLTNDHFIENSSTGPLQMTRTAVADTFNQFSINFTNRALNYSSDTATIDDLGNQILYGVRPAPATQGQFIADASVAFISATLQMQKQLYTRRTFTFKLPFVFALLEPFDIVTLTDTAMAVVQLPVRIMSTKFGADYTIQVTAQELPNELHNFTPKNQQFSLGSGLGVSIPPGTITGPVIFTGPARLTNGNLEVWVAVNGQSAAWGGCRIWLSTDNSTFELWGVLRGGSRYGFMSTAIPGYPRPVGTIWDDPLFLWNDPGVAWNSFTNIGANPDTADVLSLTLFNNVQQLNSVSAAQAANGFTLAAIFDSVPEIFSYQTATLTGPGNYSLSTLYRGILGTPGNAHPAGVPFVMLDGNLAKIPLDISLLGKTIYLKFTSFNAVGAMEQDVAQATSYSYTIGPGISSPLGPSFASITQSGILCIFVWEEDESPEATGYEIRIGLVGGTWATAFPLVRAARGSHSVSTIAPIGTWVFYIASFDSLNTYSQYRPSVTFTVVTAFQILEEISWGGDARAPQQPASARICDWAGWPGASAPVFINCFVHPTDYSLVPTDSALASFGGSTTGWDSAADLWNSSGALWNSTTGTGWDWVNLFAIQPAATSTWVSQPLTTYNNSQLVGNTAIRIGAFVYPTLWGATGAGQFPVPIGVSEFPQWDDATRGGPPVSWNSFGSVFWSDPNDFWDSVAQQSGLSGAVIHPTAYALVPDSMSLASYQGTDNGWEWVDNFVFNPFPSPSATMTFNTGGATSQVSPLLASFSAFNQSGPGQFSSPAQPTITISSSTDGVTYIPAVSGQGQQSAFVVAQYVQVTMVLDTTPNGLNYVTQLSGSIGYGTGPNYPSVSPLMADSADNITYNAFQKTTSAFTSLGYAKLQVTWNNIGGAWPFSIGSLWSDLDGEANIANGTSTISTTTPPGSSASFSPIIFRAIPRVTCDPALGTSVGSYVVVTAITTTSFSAMLFNAAGAAITGNIIWTAIGS